MLIHRTFEGGTAESSGVPALFEVGLLFYAVRDLIA